MKKYKFTQSIKCPKCNKKVEVQSAYALGFHPEDIVGLSDEDIDKGCCAESLTDHLRFKHNEDWTKAQRFSHKHFKTGCYKEEEK